ADCFAAQAPGPRPAYEQGSPGPDRALPLVFVDPSGSYHHPSRDAHPLAPLWLSLLLALEVAIYGRPAVEARLRALIRQRGMDNPLWGAPRIHGELLKLGLEVAQSSVAKNMVKRRGPPGVSGELQRFPCFSRNLDRVVVRLPRQSIDDSLGDNRKARELRR